MILVIVGQLHLSFDRLLKEMDEYAERTGERVVIQVGSSDYEPEHAEWFKFESEERLNELYDECDLLVAHGGAGTILNGISRGKPIVVVPRKKEFKEASNDHQMDLAGKMAAEGKAVCVSDIGDLPAAIEKARGMDFDPVTLDNQLVRYLSDRFAEIAEKRS